MNFSLTNFPKEWLVEVEVKRSGGRDSRGNPLPSTSTYVPNCLFAPRSSTEPLERSDETRDTAVIYMPLGTDIKSTDSVVVPGQGEYRVDGDPLRWPVGVEVPLRGGA